MDEYDDTLDILDQEDQDLEIEEYEEPDEKEFIPEEDTIFVAPRILAEQKDQIHWQKDMCGSLNTSIEGALGKKMRKATMLSRTDDERFCDAIKNVCREANIPDNIRDAVLRLRFKIPDIRYKSPAGIVYGFMCISSKGKEKNIDKSEFQRVINLIKVAPNFIKINELDIIRYAVFLKKII